MSMTCNKLLSLAAVMALPAVTTACSPGTVGGTGGTSATGSGGNGAAGQGAGGAILSGVFLDAGVSAVPRDSDVCKRLDSQGNCVCLAIASLGKVAHYGNQSGAGDNTNAFQDYMNSQTKGTARMDLFGNVVQSAKPFPLTADFLKKYDVLILQALEDSEYNGWWTFSQDEISALADWVNNGGGLITMSGYGSTTNEVDPVNQLLSFTGISYNKDDIFAQCPDNYCYCTDSSIPFGGWQSGDLPLTSNLNSTDHQVGVFHGRSIKCSDCQVMATTQANGATLKVGVHKQIGAGRVFAWADEWVTYTSQWKGDPTYMSQPDCDNHTADKIYNVPQFWYNVFRWVSGDSACFKIIDDGVVIY